MFPVHNAAHFSLATQWPLRTDTDQHQYIAEKSKIKQFAGCV